MGVLPRAEESRPRKKMPTKHRNCLFTNEPQGSESGPRLRFLGRLWRPRECGLIVSSCLAHLPGGWLGSPGAANLPWNVRCLAMLGHCGKHQVSGPAAKRATPENWPRFDGGCHEVARGSELQQAWPRPSHPGLPPHWLCTLLRVVSLESTALLAPV